MGWWHWRVTLFHRALEWLRPQKILVDQQMDHLEILLGLWTGWDVIIKRRKKTFTYIWWYRICESSTICHMDSHHFCDQCALHVDGWESTWDFFGNRISSPLQPFTPEGYRKWMVSLHLGMTTGITCLLPLVRLPRKRKQLFLDVHLFHFLCFLILFQHPTLPETNRVYPKKTWWLENDAISFLGPAIFIGAMLAANFREGRWKLAKQPYPYPINYIQFLDWMLPIQSITPPQRLPRENHHGPFFWHSLKEGTNKRCCRSFTEMAPEHPGGSTHGLCRGWIKDFYVLALVFQNILHRVNNVLGHPKGHASGGVGGFNPIPSLVRNLEKYMLLFWVDL